MSRTKKRILACLLMSTLFAGCAIAERHSSNAALLTESEPKKDKYALARDTDFSAPVAYGSNPVYIYTDSKFVISIDRVYAGWLKPENASVSNEAESGAGFRHEVVDHFRGKELWLLTTIHSLNTKDPLEANTKLYVKATNVKYDGGSFSLVPLDSDERIVFAHDSDSSYRITFRLYEVDGLTVKRELLRLSQNPGLIGAAEDILLTLKGTFGALAGDVLKRYFDRWREEPLAFERLLLTFGAVEEFHGEILLVRDGSHPRSGQKNTNSPENLVDHNYLLVDFFKEHVSTEANPTIKTLSPGTLITPGTFSADQERWLDPASCWKFKDNSAAKTPPEAPPEPSEVTATKDQPKICRAILGHSLLQFTVSQIPSQDTEQKKKLESLRDDIENKQSQLDSLNPVDQGESITSAAVQHYTDLAPPKDPVLKGKITSLQTEVDKRDKSNSALTTLNDEIALLETQVNAQDATVSLLKKSLAETPDDKTIDRTLTTATGTLNTFTANLSAKKVTHKGDIETLKSENEKIKSQANDIIKDLQNNQKPLDDEKVRLQRLQQIKAQPND